MRRRKQFKRKIASQVHTLQETAEGKVMSHSISIALSLHTERNRDQLAGEPLTLPKRPRLYQQKLSSGEEIAHPRQGREDFLSIHLVG